MSILSYNGGAVVSKEKKKVVIGKKSPLKVRVIERRAQVEDCKAHSDH